MINFDRVPPYFAIKLKMSNNMLSLKLFLLQIKLLSQLLSSTKISNRTFNRFNGRVVINKKQINSNSFDKIKMNTFGNEIDSHYTHVLNYNIFKDTYGKHFLNGV